MSVLARRLSYTETKERSEERPRPNRGVRFSLASVKRVDCIQPETSGWVNLNSFIHLFDKIGERFNGATLRQYSASRGYIFAL